MPMLFDPLSETLDFFFFSVNYPPEKSRTSCQEQQSVDADIQVEMLTSVLLAIQMSGR